jgi:hypothetical protein
MTRAKRDGTLRKVSSILRFQPEHVAVLVDGIADGTIVKRVVHDVQRIFRHIVGGWKVKVSASARGCWRLEVAGASGRHVWMFAATATLLPAVVAEKLEIFLRDSALRHATLHYPAGTWRPLPN